MSLQFSKGMVKSSEVKLSNIGVFAYSGVVFNLNLLEKMILEYYDKLKLSDWDKIRLYFNEENESFLAAAGKDEIEEVASVSDNPEQPSLFDALSKNVNKDLNDFREIIKLYLNNKGIRFQTIGIIYSKTNNDILKNLLILLDIIRKYIVIAILSNMKNDGVNLFKGNTMAIIYGLIVAPGSLNITSDWDITIFLTILGLNMFNNCKISIPWLHDDQFTFCGFFDTIYPKYNEIFDNNIYFESCIGKR